jgi:hypothetical protein
MGMDADVIGIGPLTQEILRTGGLDYDDEKYKDLPVGTIITCSFFRCVTTGMSRELADAFGIGDPFDFGIHELSKTKRPFLLSHSDWLAVQVIAENEQTIKDAAKEIECFQACWRAGWTLLYRPNF